MPDQPQASGSGEQKRYFKESLEQIIAATGPLTDVEQQDIADVLSQEALEEALRRRQAMAAPSLADMVLKRTVGTRNDAQAAQSSHRPEVVRSIATNEQVRRGAEYFLDAERQIPAKEQWEFMSAFWERQGRTVPNISAEQAARLTRDVANHPEQRIIAAPLVEYSEREVLINRGYSLAGIEAPAYEADQSDEDELNTPQVPIELAFLRQGETPVDSSVYEQLVDDPNTTIEANRHDTYSLRYATPSTRQSPSGKLVSRETYIRMLEEQGHVAVANDGSKWTVSVMDVRANSERSSKTTTELHEHVAITATAESLLTMRVLHLAAGMPSPEHGFDIINEAVYLENKKTHQLSGPVEVGGVAWAPIQRSMGVVGVDADRRDEKYFGVRSISGGL